MGTAATGLVALILTAAALPALIARAHGGIPPGPGPKLAALAPVSAVLAIVAAAPWPPPLPGGCCSRCWSRR